MLVKSAYTKNMEAYRAGVKLGEELKEVDPELVILFTSIHYYEDAEELLEGIYDALENEKLVIIGNSGDGMLVPELDFLDVGATALGINSLGKNKFFVSSIDDVDPELGLDAAVEHCVENLQKRFAADEIANVILSMDFRLDACRVMKLLENVIQTTVVGALSGDDRNFSRALVYANRNVLRRGMALLGISGSTNLGIYISAESKAVGSPGVITCIEKGSVVTHINDMTALEFIEKEAGRLIFLIEKGVIAFVVKDRVDENICYKRSISDFDYKTGKIKLLGSVGIGEIVQLCYSDIEDLVKDVKLLEEKVHNDYKDKKTIPAAAVIISCGGRKWMSDNDVSEEIRMVRREFGNKVPVIGLMSFGEFAPYMYNETCGKNLFHNMTCVLLLLGEKNR